MTTVAVVGSGIAGITAAYYISKLGHKVTVFEQERYPAMRTSYANGGQISVSNSEVWTTWSNVGKGIKWMFKKDAPLLIRPRLDHVPWLLKFLWHTVCDDYARNTIKTIRMGLESRDLYKKIIEQEGLEFDQSASGILHFYKDEKYWIAANRIKDLYENNGCEWSTFSKWASKVDPALEHFDDHCLGYAWTKDDWTGDIHKFCSQLSGILKNNYGVKFEFNDRIKSIKDLSEFDAVVVAAGIGSVELAKSVGDKLPIYPVKGYSITINIREDQRHLVPTVSLLDDQAKIVTSTLGNRFRVAGTAELAGEDYDIRRDRIEPLLRWVHENFPDLDTSDYKSWACLRPMTPSMMPIYKQSKKDRKVFYHTGHGHLGWTISPYTAIRITNLVHEHLKRL